MTRLARALAAGALLAACTGDGTYLVATITRGNVAATTPIGGLEVTLTLGDRDDGTPRLAPPAGAAFTLPLTLSLEVGAGAGAGIVGARAFATDGALVSAGSTELVFARGATAQVTVELGRDLRLGADGGTDSSALALTPSLAQFGGQPLGVRRTQACRVGNSGAGASAPLVVALTGVDAGRFALTDDGCTGVALAPAGTCDFAIAFAPAAVGHWAATVEIAPYQARLVAGVQGAGVLFSITPAGVDFGAVATGTSVVRDLTITNESTTAATAALGWQLAAGDFAIDAASTCVAGQPLAPRAAPTSPSPPTRRRRWR